MTDDALINDLRTVLNESPGNVKLRLSLVRVLQKAGDFKKALEVLTEPGTVENNRNAEYLELLGETYYQLGDFSAARTTLLEAIEQIPGNASLHVCLARVFRGLEDVDQARREIETALRLDPSYRDREIVKSMMKAELCEQKKGHLRVVQLGEEIAPQVDFRSEEPAITFEDVGGMDKLKEDIRLEIVYPLVKPELYKAYGKIYGGGILLYGPPGCGKTYIARATAGECEANFYPLFLEDVLDMWFGESEKKLSAYFNEARMNAPSVIFIDEVEAIGGKRSRMGRSAGRTLVSQFLTELDGIKTKKQGVLVIGATNAPWDVDVAMKRPGRFDKLIFVPPPDLPARIAILRIHSRNKPLLDVDFPRIGRLTDGFSGADLMSLCEDAVAQKLRESIRSGQVEKITTDDYLKALEDRTASTREWFGITENYVRYGNQSGVFNDLADYMRTHELLH